jgi:hypothetical protein
LQTCMPHDEHVFQKGIEVPLSNCYRACNYMRCTAWLISSVKAEHMAHCAAVSALAGAVLAAHLSIKAHNAVAWVEVAVHARLVGRALLG